MSDFERSGMTFDEPARRRSPGTWFADLGDRLARGLNNFDRPPTKLDHDEPEWEEYEEYEEYEEAPEQPTAVADPIEWEPALPASRKRFPTAMHGYDREAVDAHLAALEHEIAELKVHRVATPTVEAEIKRVGEETSAILKVAHEQAAEITRRAQAQADRCVADAAANAVAMTEDAKRKLRQLDSETDAVWAERGRLIEDVRNVATALFSLAEDAADRFPEDADRRGPGEPAPVVSAAAAAPAPPSARSAAPSPSPQSAPTPQPSPQSARAPQPSPQSAPAPQPSPQSAAPASPRVGARSPGPSPAPAPPGDLATG